MLLYTRWRSGALQASAPQGGPAAAAAKPAPPPPNPAPQLYEKRKLAALEVEQLVKQLSASGNTERISAVIDALVNTYATSSQARLRPPLPAARHALLQQCAVCLRQMHGGR